MIRAVGSQGGTPTIILVLERGNVERLKADRPIQVDLHGLAPAHVPGPLVLVIAYDEDLRETTAAMLARAKETDATIHVVPRGPEEPQ
jgi:hypothetical protein